MKEYLFAVTAPLSALGALSTRYGDRISAYRKKKLAELRSEQDRKRGLLAEYCLIEALRLCDPELSLPLTIDTERYGKPFLVGRGEHISLSHAGEYAAAAVCSKPVGIDIERTRPIGDALAKRICTEREYREVWQRDPREETFRNLFSAKESCVKCSGEGLMALSKVDTLTVTTIRQHVLEPYILSIATECEMEGEIYRCDTNGSLVLLS